MTYLICCGPDGLHSTAKPTSVEPLTMRLCAQIARYNGFLSPKQVREALLARQSVYTNFSRYWLDRSAD